MNHDFAPGVTSVASNALLLSSTVQLLQHVEALPSGATGALSFGEQGVILIENKRICWAVASDMKQRLTDILCQQTTPPLPRSAVEELVRRCKQDGKPVGEALVESGFVSEVELRAALERHTCEAIVRLAQSNVTPTRFLRHTRHGYDPRFVFSTAELLASLSGTRRTQLGIHARAHLASVLVPDAGGFAYLLDPRSRRPVIIAVDRGCDLAVSAALEIASWASGVFDLASFVDDETHIVTATWCARIQLLAWRQGDVCYAAVCSSRAASALLLSQVGRRLAREPSPKAAQGGDKVIP